MPRISLDCEEGDVITSKKGFCMIGITGHKYRVFKAQVGFHDNHFIALKKR